MVWVALSLASVGRETTLIPRTQQLVSLALLSGISAPFQASGASTIEPGLWSYRARTFITGDRRGEQCVKADQVDDFLTGPRNRHYRCVYPSRSIGAGNITFAGDCLDKGDRNRYHLEVHGHYRQEAFELDGVVKGTFFGLSISVPMSIKAHRLSADCKSPP